MATAVSCVAWGNCSRLPWGKGTFIPSPWVKPQTVQWGFSSLHLLNCGFRMVFKANTGVRIRQSRPVPPFPCPERPPSTPLGAYLRTTYSQGSCRGTNGVAVLPTDAIYSRGAANMIYSTFVTPSVSTGLQHYCWSLIGLGPYILSFPLALVQLRQKQVHCIRWVGQIGRLWRWKDLRMQSYAGTGKPTGLHCIQHSFAAL